VGPGSGRERRVFRSANGKTRVTFRDRSLAGEPVIGAFSFGHSGPTEIEVPSNRPAYVGSSLRMLRRPGNTEVFPVATVECRSGFTRFGLRPVRGSAFEVVAAGFRLRPAPLIDPLEALPIRRSIPIRPCGLLGDPRSPLGCLGLVAR
jgi:hypothetical protein